MDISRKMATWIFSEYLRSIISGVEDSKMMFLLFIRKNNCRVNPCRMVDWGSRGESLRLVVGVKNIKMPLLLKASRKDRICLD